MLKMLFKLPVIWLKRIEVIEERVHSLKVIFWLLVSFNLIGSVNLTLLFLLFLGVADDRADTESIGKFNLELVHLGGYLRVIQVQVGLELLNLFTHLVALFLEKLRGGCELFNQLVDIRAECFLEFARE